MKEFELVQVHECGSYAEVVIRDKTADWFMPGIYRCKATPKRITRQIMR